MTRVAATLGLRSVPALLVSSEADGPFATGVWSQAVVLPRALADNLDDGRLEAVLAHELLHHRRRDLPLAWCAAAVTSVFWFSPIAWRLARKLTELRELCCDAGVVRAGIASPREYVETLLTAAAVPARASAMPMHDGHPLGRRLRRLLDQPDPMPRAVSVLILVLFALLWLPATPFTRAPAGDAHIERIVIVRP
jgi:beta-lactamase regulating signal transducer with metallopeptidase domain